MAGRRLTPRARELRRNQTDAEALLWSELRGRRLADAKFLRQYQVGDFIADFACRSLRIAIELDGGQHSENAHDIGRTRLIEAHGYRVIRFWNNEIMENLDGVLQTIDQELALGRNRCPKPSPARERDTQTWQLVA